MSVSIVFPYFFLASSFARQRSFSKHGNAFYLLFRSYLRNVDSQYALEFLPSGTTDRRRFSRWKECVCVSLVKVLDIQNTLRIHRRIRIFCSSTSIDLFSIDLQSRLVTHMNTFFLIFPIHTFDYIHIKKEKKATYVCCGYNNGL